MDRLAAYATFAKVVELGSFSRAAERLSVSTSAASRLVADLEAHLGARLLNRTTRRLSLTEAGQAFYERCVQMLADLEDAESTVRSSSVSPRGTLRVTCGVSFGLRYLAPVLADFAAANRDVVLDLDLSDRAVDLVEEGYDVAVRIGSIGSPGMVSRRLGWTQLVCCASPAYLAARVAPLEPADLEAHECLSYTNVGLPNAWRFEPLAGGEPVTARVPQRHRANNGQLLAAMAVAGLGIVYTPDFIVADEIRSGQLVRLLPRHRPPRSPIAAVYPSRRHLSAKVRAFVDYAAARFERDPPWRLEGDGET